MDEKRSTSATSENFVSPVVWVIQQTPEQLVLERKRGANVDRFTYPLLATRPNAPDQSVKAPTPDAPGNRGYWTGDRLMLETHVNIQGKTVTAREVLMFTTAGELNVERVVEVEHGYTMKGAQNFNSAKDVFRKAQ